MTAAITFPTISKAITLEKMQRFMGPVTQSIHADPELAKSWGVGTPIVQGGHLVAFINELMLRSFGNGFLLGGDVSVTFIKPVRPGDTVMPRATPTRRTTVDGRERVDCDVWLENQNGDKVCVGTAHAFVG